MTDKATPVQAGIDPLAAEIEAGLEGCTEGQWYPGHLADDTHSCNCTSILAENGRFGSIADITVDNGLRIGDGGNDGPPVEEAKRNLAHIARCCPDNIAKLIAGYRSQAERIAALEVERDEALEGPWSKWADELRKYLMKFGVDPGDEWDLPEQYEMWMSGVVEAETARAEAAESLLAEAREALERIVAASETGASWDMSSNAELEMHEIARATLSRLKPGEKGGGE